MYKGSAAVGTAEKEKAIIVTMASFTHHHESIIYSIIASSASRFSSLKYNPPNARMV
jgi:hypothetical protein